MSMLADLRTVLAGWKPDDEISEDILASEVLDQLDACFVGSPFQRPAGEVSPWALGAFFREVVAIETMGPDGHPRSGHGFIPPILHQGRIHAGTEMTVHSPMRADTLTRRTTRLHAVDVKESTSGALLFAAVERTYTQDGVCCLVEIQRHAYRLARRATAPVSVGLPVERGSGFRHASQGILWSADEVTLFRFSAITANTHRIHYDADYARGEEGYPGLVVHGPMQVIALELTARAQAKAQSRQPSLSGVARLRHPLFVGDTVAVVVSDGKNIIGAELRGSGDRVVASLVLHDVDESVVPPS